MIRLIKDELLIILGTSSSETVLPRLLAKLEAAGASRRTVGVVIPTGYSFNLDGSCSSSRRRVRTCRSASRSRSRP